MLPANYLLGVDWGVGRVNSPKENERMAFLQEDQDDLLKNIVLTVDRGWSHGAQF